jgi:hypothetical protein
MDPISLAVPVLVVMGGKVVEKWGEKIGEKTFEAGEKLLKSIAHQSPETAEKLKQLQPGDVIDAEIVEEVRQIAAVDSTVKAEVEAVATALQQSGGAQYFNFGKAANVGVVLNQTNNF